MSMPLAEDLSRYFQGRSLSPPRGNDNPDPTTYYRDDMSSVSELPASQLQRENSTRTMPHTRNVDGDLAAERKVFQRDDPSSQPGNGKRTPHITVRDVKAAAGKLLIDLIGTSNLQVEEGDKDTEVDRRVFETIKGSRLGSHASFLAQGSTPVKHAARVEAHGLGLSSDPILSEDELAKYDMVWAVRHFGVGGNLGIEETGLIHSTSISGRQGEKLYLYAVVNCHKRGMLLLPMLLRNDTGVKDLPHDTKAYYVRVLAIGKDYDTVEGSLPPLSMGGRDVSDGMSMFLLPTPVDYGDHMYSAKGFWQSSSRDLIHRYMEAAIAHANNMYAEEFGFTWEDLMDADQIIEKEVGDIDTFFATQG